MVMCTVKLFRLLVMNKIGVLFFSLLISIGISQQLRAQKKYWVKFTDKTGTPYSISNPSAFLTQKSINRRTAFNIPIVQSDLPVNPSYVTQVDNIAGVTIHYASKWMNGVVISASSPSCLVQIKALPFVQDTSKVNKYKLNNLGPQLNTAKSENFQELRTASTGSYNYGGATWQNKQLKVDCLHNQGFRGQGFIIAVMDVGFSNVDVNPYFDSIRSRGQILGTRDFISGGTNVYDNEGHGMNVLSCMAAIKPGVIIGSAPGADFWLLRTEEGATETISEEYNWIRGAEFADSVGAHILTTSLGYTTFDDPNQNHTYSTLNGKTAPMSIAANLAARKGMLVFNSAGNEGSNLSWLQHISVPADADSICTVGAIDSLGVVAPFSGIGPTFDGRIKPDLVAMGVNDFIVYNETFAGPGANGTSFSAPILAGAAACFWQAHRSFSNINVLTTLKSTASNSLNPNNSMGWGIPNMCAIPVGINEQINNSELNCTVSPNPFNTEIRIDLNFSGAEVYDLCISDLSGKVVYHAHGNNLDTSKSLQLSQLNAGFYILRLSTSSGTLSKKLLKNP
jgi:serine protease AprX